MSFEEILNSIDENESLLEVMIKKVQANLSHLGGKRLQDFFKNTIALSIIDDKLPVSEQDELKMQLERIFQDRNIIEHNKGVVNRLYIKKHLWTKLKPGDELEIGIEQVGNAINVMELIAANLNKRVVKKFGLSRE